MHRCVWVHTHIDKRPIVQNKIVSLHQLLKEIFCEDLMEPINIILLNPIIKTYCSVWAVHGEQYLGMAWTSTSKYSFCSCWQKSVQSLLASRSGRHPNYKYVYTVISLPPVWLTLAATLLCLLSAIDSKYMGSARTMQPVSSSPCPVRYMGIYDRGGNLKWC